MAVMEWPAPVSCTFVQSRRLEAASHSVVHVCVSFPTSSPPTTQWLALLTSVASGAMTRGLGSQFAIGAATASRQEGVMVRKLWPPSVVRYMFRYTYSPTAALALSGLTMTPPPSPPA